MSGRLIVTLALPDRRLCGNAKSGASRGANMARAKLVRAARRAASFAGREALLDEAWPHLEHDRLGRAAAVEALDTLLVDGWRLWPTGRVRLDAEACYDPTWAARPLDDDNFWRGLKPQRDGLADAGIVRDDRQFRIGDLTWRAVPPCHGEVIVTLTLEETP